MRQRLALAAALLGDPGVLILDEPANGLDPEGIAWLRSFLRSLAAEGRTVLVSSHVLSEVQQTVDDVVVITHGRLVHAGPLDALTTAAEVRVRTPQRDALVAALGSVGTLRPVGSDALVITGRTTDEVGAIAFRAGVELHELSATTSDLEEAFLALTATGPGAGAA
jgi:ABC-2 type transport system ATP-binding protein